MLLTRGTRLGPYEIQSALGAGGMGEVYRARDTRLDRVVAIKVLRAHLAADPDRRARFEREAKLISQLSHPHICTLYDVGQADGIDFLVVEYLEGQTLADRLQKGPLPIAQALDVAIQIAGALDAAHRVGIVHRDLKPANVMLTKAGAKLLDFGIAKAVSPDVDAPTAAATLTAEGALLGTVPYMSPEQLEGRGADARSDLFAFGAVLYEMLSGRRAFVGASQSAVIAAIRDSEPPPMGTAGPLAPPALDHLVTTCLAKDPDERWQDAGDVRRQLQWIASAGKTQAPIARAGRGRLGWASMLVLLTIASAAALTWRLRLATPADAPEMRLQIVTPSGTDLTDFALSPDGRTLAFTATVDGRTQIWLKKLDTGTSGALSGTDDGNQPFWAPDNRTIGFFADQKLKRIDVESGSVQTLAAAVNPYLGTWGSGGTILFAPSTDGPLYRVAASGGAAVVATHLQAGQTEHRTPRFLPDGRHFLFFAWGSAEARGVYLGSLDGGEPRRLFDADAGPAEFIAPNLVVFVRQGALMAQRVRLDTLTAVGEPVAIAPHIAVTGLVGLSKSSAGVIAFRPERETSQLVWLDRSGRQVGVLGEPDQSPRGYLRFSPDRRTLALSRRDAGNFNIWLVDVAGGGLQRFTFDNNGNKLGVVWSPDGRRLVFSWDPAGKLDLYARALVGAAGGAPLLASAAHKQPLDWSPDGRFVIYGTTASETGADLWALPLAGDRKPLSIARTTFREDVGRISPDGRWVAYQSNETGRFEIYVQSFPEPGEKVKVSASGGRLPEWRTDGRELFYLSLDDRLMAAPLALTNQTVSAGRPVSLFDMPQTPKTVELRTGYQYGVASDGQRFLVNKIVADASPITVLLNWRAPSK